MSTELKAKLNDSKSWSIGAISEKIVQKDGKEYKIKELRLNKDVTISYKGVELPLSKYKTCNLFKLSDEDKSETLKGLEQQYNFNTIVNVSAKLVKSDK